MGENNSSVMIREKTSDSTKTASVTQKFIMKHPELALMEPIPVSQQEYASTDSMEINAFEPFPVDFQRQQQQQERQ